MKIIVGLGNPGPQYETTRHNVGFLAIDRLVDLWKASGPVTKHQGQIYQCAHSGESIYLVKPQTYMNLSGKTVAPLFNFYHCKPEDLVVIHDDVDLPAFSIRLKTGGGTGGHNGLKSIDECLGKDNNSYHRIRIGIGHPRDARPAGSEKSKTNMAGYVLDAFSNQELKELDILLDDVAEATREILEGRIQAAMNKFHQRSK